MLTKSDAQVAMLAVETLDAAMQKGFELAMSIKPHEFLRIIGATDELALPPKAKAEEMVNLIEEARVATRTRFDELYRTLNLHLNDEAVT